MVRYTVLWRKEVLNELADRWISYHDRGELTAAADLIDAELSSDAHQKGYSIGIGQKSLASGPLSVIFRVDEGDRKVMVEGIGLTESN